MDEIEVVEPAAPEVVDNTPVDDGKPVEPYAAFKARIDGKPLPEAKTEVAEDKPATEPEAKPEQEPKRETRPYRNAIPPQRAQQMHEDWQRREAELQTEIRLLRERVGTPVEEKPTPAVDTTPKKPDPKQFVSDDGTFDGEAYSDAVSAYTQERVFEALRREQAQAAEKTAQAERQQAIAEMQNAWRTQAKEIAQRDPEVEASLAWIGSDEVAAHIPGAVQLEILASHPLVAHAIASRQDLLDIVTSGDVRAATRMIGVIDDRIRSHMSRQPSEPTETREPVESSAPTKPAVPARPEPKGPSDVGAGVSSGGGGGSSYKAYRERMLEAERRNRR